MMNIPLKLGVAMRLNVGHNYWLDFLEIDGPSTLLRKFKLSKSVVITTYCKQIYRETRSYSGIYHHHGYDYAAKFL